MTDHQLINQTSGETEYYTPVEIVDAARRVMGGIELDPASSEGANRAVIADRFFTAEINGLAQPWIAKSLWMNHPFHRGWKACTVDCQRASCAKRGHHIYHDIPSNTDWINKLCSSIGWEKVQQACNITFAATSEKWFQPLLDRPQCFLYPRTNYRKPDGTILKGITKGSVVTYFGPNVAAFAREFRRFGKVKVSYAP